MPKFWNIVKANAEIESAHTAADALLTTAKISVLKVDGKDVAASEAPLAVKIAAFTALQASGDKSQDVSELIASNGQLAAQVETLEAKNTVLEATQSAHVQKISGLETELTTQKSSVASLTAANTELTNRLSASNAEAARVTGIVNATNAEISGYALKANCLELAVAKDATDAQKLEAANAISVGDKMKAIFGAVNAAVAKTGVSFAAIPALPTTTAAGAKTELSGRARFNSAVRADFTGK